MNPLFALYVWPIVVITLFSKYRVAFALSVSIFAGYLLLPGRTEIDFPLLPPLNKDTVPVMVALLMAISAASKLKPDVMRPAWLPQSPIALSLLAASIVGAFMTTVTNGDALQFGPRRLQGLQMYDAFSSILSMIFLILPFLLARKFLARPSEHRLLLIVLCIAGLLYSLPSLYEVRMSPQLNRIVYGFFPHSWLQHIRGNGFRPLVFLEHGLFLGIFLSGCLLATVGLIRGAAKSNRQYYILALVWLSLTLVLSKNFGALGITIVLAPIVFFLTVRMQLIVAAAFGVLVITYPMARGAQLIPVDWVVEKAEAINPQRAESLTVRLVNEEAMLDRVQSRKAFGWGGWSRSRIFDEYGRDVTIADGYWIIVLGVGGWTRYISEFGLLIFPLFLLVLHKRRYDVGIETSTLAVILAGNAMDLLPNAGITPITWMIAGALWGRLELKRVGDGTLEFNQDAGLEEAVQTSSYVRTHSKFQSRSNITSQNTMTKGSKVGEAQDKPAYTRYKTLKQRYKRPRD